MATFNVGIGKDDVQEGVLLPEDWYTMKITREPYQDKNSHWKGAGEKLPFDQASEINPKAGENIVVNLTVVSEIPEFSGRSFTKWLPLPNPNDENLYMNDGQPKADWKAGVIHKWVEEFGGVSEGAEVSLSEAQEALVYVTQEIDNRDGSDGSTVNTISMNVHPRGIGTGGSSPLGDASTPTLDGAGTEATPAEKSLPF
jgi:hypothetical protein